MQSNGPIPCLDPVLVGFQLGPAAVLVVALFVDFSDVVRGSKRGLLVFDEACAVELLHEVGSGHVRCGSKANDGAALEAVVALIDVKERCVVNTIVGVGNVHAESVVAKHSQENVWALVNKLLLSCSRVVACRVKIVVEPVVAVSNTIPSCDGSVWCVPVELSSCSNSINAAFLRRRADLNRVPERGFALSTWHGRFKLASNFIQFFFLPIRRH